MAEMKYTVYGFLNPDWREPEQESPDEEEDKLESFDKEGIWFLDALNSHMKQNGVQFQCTREEAEWIVLGLSTLLEHLPDKTTDLPGRIRYLRRQIRSALAEIYFREMRKKL